MFKQLEYLEILFKNLLLKFAYATKVRFILKTYFRTDRNLPDRVNRSTRNSLVKFRKNVLVTRSLEMTN